VDFRLAFHGDERGTPIARWWDMRKLGAFAIRAGMRYVWLLLILSALASTRCSTTIQSSRGAAPTSGWMEEHDSSGATVTVANGSAVWQIPGVLSRAAPALKEPSPEPARIQLISTLDGSAIPLENAREVKVVKRGRGALEGALIGLGVGILSGAVLGLVAGDSANRTDCGYPCTGEDKAKVTGAVLGGFGTGLGAIVGAAVGHRDILTF